MNWRHLFDLASAPVNVEDPGEAERHLRTLQEALDAAGAALAADFIEGHAAKGPPPRGLRDWYASEEASTETAKMEP